MPVLTTYVSRSKDSNNQPSAWGACATHFAITAAPARYEKSMYFDLNHKQNEGKLKFVFKQVITKNEERFI